MNSHHLNDGGVRIRPIEDSASDTAAILRWRNLPAVREQLFSQQAVNEQTHQAWLERFVRTGKSAQFIIEIMPEQLAAGTVFLKGIDPDNRSAELGIFIGESMQRLRGVGSAACRLAVRHGFEVLHLNRIFLQVFEHNTPAIRCYEKVGFATEGILRQSYCRDGQFFDVRMMAVLRSDWQ